MILNLQHYLTSYFMCCLSWRPVFFHSVSQLVTFASTLLSICLVYALRSTLPELKLAILFFYSNISQIGTASPNIPSPTCSFSNKHALNTLLLSAPLRSPLIKDRSLFSYTHTVHLPLQTFTHFCRFFFLGCLCCSPLPIQTLLLFQGLAGLPSFFHSFI